MSVKEKTTVAVRPVSILLDHTTATASVAFRGLEPLSVKVYNMEPAEYSWCWLKLKGICGHCRVRVWACVGMCGRVWACVGDNRDYFHLFQMLMSALC